MRFQGRKEFDLETIYVAKPCPASWESMTGDERSRKCSQCDRTVYNISGLSRSEASSLVANRKDRMCVRLHRRQDGTIITKDCPKGLRAYRMRVAKYAGSVFAAIIGLFSVSYGQRPPTPGDSQGIRSETSLGVPRIEGIITDPAGMAIPNATITVTTSSGKTIVRKTDRRGRFSLMGFALANGENQLKIEVTGFNPFRDDFAIRRNESINYPIVLDVGFTVGVVEVRSEPLIDPKKSGVSTTIRFND